MSAGDSLAMPGVERDGCLVRLECRRFEFDDLRPSLNGALRGLAAGLLSFGPGLLCGCSQYLGFCRGLLQRELVRGVLGLSRLGSCVLGFDDPALGVCRRLLRSRSGLLRVGELRPCFGEGLFELDNSVGGLLGLYSELCLQLVSAGDGFVMLGL